MVGGDWVGFGVGNWGGNAVLVGNGLGNSVFLGFGVFFLLEMWIP